MYLGFPAIDEGNEPPLQLKGFSKVMLNPGEAKTVELKLDTRAFSYWSEKSARAWPGGGGRIPSHGGEIRRRILRLKEPTSTIR